MAATFSAKVRFLDDGTPGGCLAAPRGRIAIRGRLYRKPCNGALCRYCDPLRDALREAQTRNVVLTVGRERRRILSGVRAR